VLAKFMAATALMIFSAASGRALAREPCLPGAARELLVEVSRRTQRRL
jgi:hypothetical protein